MGVSFLVDPVHMTAAGNAFNGAMEVASGRSDASNDAVHFTNAVGVLYTTRQGAQPSLPAPPEVTS